MIAINVIYWIYFYGIKRRYKMVYGTYKATLSPISPMLTFLRVLGISGGFPMTPLASRILYDGSKFVSDENDRYSSSFSNSKSTYYVAETSWDSYHTFEIRTPRLIWCYLVNTLIWIIPLVIFLAISYGCEFSGIDYLFPLNASLR